MLSRQSTADRVMEQVKLLLLRIECLSFVPGKRLSSSTDVQKPFEIPYIAPATAV